MRVAFAGPVGNPGRNLARAMAMSGDRLALLGGDREELVRNGRDLEIRTLGVAPVIVPLRLDALADAFLAAGTALAGLDAIVLQVDELFAGDGGGMDAPAALAILAAAVPPAVELAAATLAAGTGGVVCLLTTHQDDAALGRARHAALRALTDVLDRQYAPTGVRLLTRSSRQVVGPPTPAQARTAWVTARGRRRAFVVRRSIARLAAAVAVSGRNPPLAVTATSHAHRYPEFAGIEIANAIGVSPVGSDTRLLARSAAAIEASTILEMGVGCGLVAIYLARLGRRVLGTDLNARAVRCTHVNAARNRVAVTVIESDLFSRVSGRVDLIVFNPPFGNSRSRWFNHQIEWVKSLLPKEDPRLHRLANRWILAGRASLLAQFLAEAPHHLTPGGQILLLLHPSEMPLATNYDCEILPGDVRGLRAVRAHPR